MASETNFLSREISSPDLYQLSPSPPSSPNQIKLKQEKEIETKNKSSNYLSSLDNSPNNTPFANNNSPQPITDAFNKNGSIAISINTTFLSSIASIPLLDKESQEQKLWEKRVHELSTTYMDFIDKIIEFKENNLNTKIEVTEAFASNRVTKLCSKVLGAGGMIAGAVTGGLLVKGGLTISVASSTAGSYYIAVLAGAAGGLLAGGIAVTGVVCSPCLISSYRKANKISEMLSKLGYQATFDKIPSNQLRIDRQLYENYKNSKCVGKLYSSFKQGLSADLTTFLCEHKFLHANYQQCKDVQSSSHSNSSSSSS